MGGPQIVDSKGDVWLGDPGAGQDVLQIRPNDAGGSNAIVDWCGPAGDTVAALGFNPTHPADRSLLGTIRWDTGGDGIDFLMEIPLDDGIHQVNMYFNECCCPGRHFKVQIQGVTVDDDVSMADYDLANPGIGRAGRLTFEGILVFNGILRIALLPCPTCPGASDTNAIIDALEILRTGDLPVLQLAGDCNGDGRRTIADLTCQVKLQFGRFLFLDRTPQAPPCSGALNSAGNLAVLDMNGDAKNDLSDIVGLARFIFLGQLPPQGSRCFGGQATMECPVNPVCQ
jgi:hypothetical protein